ncbi:MAG: AAA family ATPase, partial [Calditerrivibrio sp.]|nr:AAA family ATPase [Calditerrivibrio sp.]
MKKRLPIGESNIANLINEGFLYVDKTYYIYKLLISSKYHFLSRPRRFGKSLLVSTLEQVFKGNRELFKGLWIEKSDYDWEKYVVIKFDFNTISLDNPDILVKAIEFNLSQKAEEFGLSIKGTGIKEQFVDLVNKVYKKYRSSIVVLIDEYDKPIITHLGLGEDRLEIAKGNRDILKSFYGTLKGADVIEKLRFVLLTGVSKFSKTGVFSELNNLFDLTMDSNYSAMLGITDEE